MNISDTDKQALLDGTALIPYKINILQDGEVIKTLDENSIVNVDVEDFRYVDTDSIVVGQFVAKKVTGELDKIYTEFSIEDTEIELQMGVEVDGTTTYYSLGHYLITKPTTDDVTDKTSFEGLDYTKKFNQVFNSSGLTFPCTALQLAQYCCDKCGVELATTDFTNYDFEVTSNQFDSDATYRDVMKCIGQLAYSWVRIDYDDKCYIDFSVPTEVASDYDKITASDYYDLDMQEKVHGPVNRVVIGMSNVEGENITVEDTDSITTNGVCELKVMDNNLTNTPELRTQVSESAKRLFGLKYLPLEINTTGHPWLTGKELIQITTPDSDVYETIPFDRTIAYSGHIKTKLSAKADTTTETTYKSTASMESEIKKTRVLVDKDSQRIDLLAENATEQETKISDLSVEVDNIKASIEDDIDLTIINSSNTASVDFENVYGTYPVELRIRPIGEDISYLYPSKNLFPSSTTFLKIRDILFTNTTTGETFKYTLPMDLWYLDEDTYDEFYLDYVNNVCQVTQRVDWNSNQEKYKLDKEVTYTFELPEINLTSGNYTISLPGYSAGYIYARMVEQSEYNSLFATKAELNSSITLLNNSITLDVTDKLSKKADSDDITTIEGQLALKIDKDDNDQIVSMLNASADVIKLTSNRFSVTSDYLTITEEGKITAVSGEFGGFNLTSDSFSRDVTGIYNYNTFDSQLAVMDYLGFMDIDSPLFDILDTNDDSSISLGDVVRIARIALGTLENTKEASGTISINSNNVKGCLTIEDSTGEQVVAIGVGGVNSKYIVGEQAIIGTSELSSDGGSITPHYITMNGTNGNLVTSGDISCHGDLMCNGSGTINGSLTIKGTLTSESGTFSTTEIDTGKTWLGKTIYRKLFSISNIPAMTSGGGTSQRGTDVSSSYQVINYYGYYNLSAGYTIPLQFNNPGVDSNVNCYCYTLLITTGTYITIETHTYWEISDGYVVLEYTKD